MTQLEMFEDVIFEVILKKKKILSPACLLGKSLSCSSSRPANLG